MGLYKNKRSGFTLMEIAISVLIVAIVTLVTLPVIRGQLQRSDEYSYYLAFRTVEKLGGQIAALGDPDYAKTTNTLHKLDIASLPAAKLHHKYAIQSKSHPILAKLSKNIANAEWKVFKALFPKAYADYNIDYKLFTSDKIYDIYKYSTVCVNGSADVYYSHSDLSTIPKEFYNLLDDEGKANYFTQSSYCNSGQEESMSKQDQLDKYLMSLLSNESCFKQSKICTTVGDPNCENKILNKRNAALSELKGAINSYKADAGNYICSNIVKKYCDGSVAYNNVSETMSNAADDDGVDAGTIDQCVLTTTVHEEPIVESSAQTWYPNAAPSCSSLGYINTENKAEASSQAWVNGVLQSNQQIYNDCQCISGYSWSENNNKVCCQNPQNPYALAYYINETSCKECTTDFNVSKKSCCANNSTYNSSNGKCECVAGYSGDGDSAAGCVRSSCPPGMLLDEDAKVCVPAPPLISAKRFCELIVANWNTASYSCSTFSGTPSKYESVYNAAYKENTLNSIKGTSGAFNSIAPNIVFSNGLKLWILGDRAASIPGLSYDPGNAAATQNMCIDLNKTTAASCSDAGGYFCSSEYHCMKLDGTSYLGDARNCCSAAIAVEGDSDLRNMALSGFTVYVDINGSKGDGTLWRDVFPFYVTTTGRVYPAYPLDGAEAHVGGNNSAYLSTDVYYYKAGSNSRKRVLAFSEISYADAVCKAGLVNPNAPYCLNLGSVATGDNPCTRVGADDATTKCFVSIRKKAKFL